MTRTLGSLALAVLSSALAATASAQEFAAQNVFVLATAPGPKFVEDPDTELKSSPNVGVRPNSPSEVYAYVKNPAAVEKTYTVELRGTPGTPLAATARATVPAGKWARIRFAKPAAPAVPPAPVAKNAPKEELPPGTELIRADGRTAFTLRLLDADGADVLDKASGKPYGRTVSVAVRQPSEYVNPPDGTITRSGALTQIKLAVTAKPELGNQSALLDLSFPPQAAMEGATLRDGFYRRTLAQVEGQPGPAKAVLVGSVENAGRALRTDVGVDGFARAFIYDADPSGDVKSASLIRVIAEAVRVLPAAEFATNAVTAPVGTVALRIETDNAPSDATLELHVRPEGAGDSLDVNEIVRLGGPRDERVWLDLVGPNDGGLLISNRTTDWAKNLDVTKLRGKQEVVGVLRFTKGGKPTTVRSAPFVVAVDGTAPEKIEFGKFPKQLIKGTPLTVRVSAAEPDTAIRRAIFFVGDLTEDGKLPPTKVEGKPEQVDKLAWAADLPMPDKKGSVVIGVQFTNTAGLTSTKVQKIELVDPPVPPPPAGDIEGRVELGGRPQPGLIVALRGGPEGKVLATATTNDFGKFKFEKLTPGPYSVATAKPDSGVGTKGAAPAQVENKKTTKVTISLTRKP